MGKHTHPTHTRFPSFLPGAGEILVTSKSCDHLKMMWETSPAFLQVPTSSFAFQKPQPRFGRKKAGFALQNEGIWTSKSTLGIFFSFQVLPKKRVGAAPGPGFKHPVSSPPALPPAEMHLHRQPSSIPSTMVFFPSLAAQNHHLDSLFLIQVRDDLFQAFSQCHPECHPRASSKALAGKGHSYKTPVKEEAAVIKTL